MTGIQGTGITQVMTNKQTSPLKLDHCKGPRYMSRKWRLLNSSLSCMPIGLHNERYKNNSQLQLPLHTLPKPNLEYRMTFSNYRLTSPHTFPTPAPICGPSVGLYIYKTLMVQQIFTCRHLTTAAGT